MFRQSLKMLFLVLALCAGSASFAQGQSWPAAKPVRIVIAFGPGSASDIFARLLAEQLSKALGQAVIVEAKPGAAGQIAAEHVANAPADGYTLFLTTNTTHSANPYLFKNLRYHPVRDFTPVIRIGYFPFVLLVRSTHPVKSVSELVAYAKANPLAANYAYSSSAGQIAAAALSNSTGMQAVGVAYKSAPEAITSVMGEQVLFTILDFATTHGVMGPNSLKALAVTPQERSALAPGTPTIAEETGLKDFGVVAWMGLFGPANLPAAITNRLYAELHKILSADDLKSRIKAMGAEPAIADPVVFGAFVKSQLAVWERQIRIAGMQAQ